MPVSIDDETKAVTAEAPTAAVVAPVITKKRLSGGFVNRAGTVRAVVFPFAYGMRRPAWKEQQIAYDIMGVAGDSAATAQGAAARLYDASGGIFRLNAAMVFPHLVDPAGNDEQIRQTLGNPMALKALARRIILPWGRKANLASYDNDGPDGLPSSGDDDGAVDLPIILIETDALVATAIVNLNETIQTSKSGKFHARLGSVLVIALTRKDAADPDNFTATQGILRALGAGSQTVFLAGNPAGEVTPETREETGWTTPEVISRSGSYALEDWRPIAIPVTDVPGGRARWLVERGGSRIFAARMVRLRDGRWTRTEERQFGVAEGYTLHLSALGERGPIARIENSTATVILAPGH